MTPPTTPDCERIRVELGAYVLGALDPAGAAAVREHLATCPECRAAHDELTPLPRLLSSVSVEDAQRATESPDADGARGEFEAMGAERTLWRVRGERRRARRRRFLAVASVTVLVAMVGVGGWAASRWTLPAQPAVVDAPTSVGDPVTWTAADDSRTVDAEVTMIPVPWGTRVDLVMSGVERGKLCHLVIVDSSGEEWSAGSWEVTYDGGVTWSGGVGVRAERIREIVVYLPNQDPLLTLRG